VNSTRLAFHLLGTDWEGLLAAPRIDRFLRSELFERGQGAAVDFPANADSSARQGYAGTRIVAELRAASSEAVVAEAQRMESAPAADAHLKRALTERAFPSADALVRHLCGLVEEACDGAPNPPAATRSALVLWGQRLSLAECLDVSLNPPRPAMGLDGD